MANNHIIIALGGRGGDSLKAFRKVLFRNALTKEKANSFPIQYLYVDSSSNDLQEGWDDELGIDYSIDDWARINTREDVELGKIFNNLAQYPTIKPWIGDKNIWAEMSLDTEMGAGQLRKLGRIYFAASVYNQRNNSFTKNLKIAHDKVTRISKSSFQTSYHILAGLSGGTGSGTIIDTISLVSKFIEENSLREDKIIVYAILPERNVQDKDTLGFYYPNAYAALKEINAVGLFSDTEINPLYYRPINIEDFIRDNENRIIAKYTSCFIFSNENEKSRVIDYKKGLPNMIGDFLYHTIITLPRSRDGQDAYIKLTENSVVSTETDKFSGKKERAVKFASAAIKRIEIPELEVIDLYGAKMAQQFVLQQKYNNWADTKGYLNNPGEDKTTDFIENRSRKDNFLHVCEVTLEHLSLKTPHGGDDYRNADDEWDTISERLMQNSNQVYAAGQEKQPIIYFNRYMDQFFNNQFRGNGLGVEKYWAEKTKDIEQQSVFFYKKIEEYLLDLWVSINDRVVGLNEIEKIIERLILELSTISTRAANRVSHLIDPSKFDVKDADYTIAGCNKEITVLLKEFGKVIRLRKSTTIFSEAASFITKLYKNKTDVIAYNFAVKLIERLIKKLDNLSDTVRKINEEVCSVESKLTDIISEKNKLFNKGNDEKSYHSNNVLMLYKEGSVEREFGIVLNERSTILNELKSFRKFIRDKCAKTTFEDLHKNLKVDLLTKEYLYLLNARIPSIYNTLQEDGKINANDKLIGRNVLNYFEKEFKSVEELESFFKNIKEETGVYARISSSKAETLDSTGIMNYANDVYVIQFPAYRINEDAEKYESQFTSLLAKVFPNSKIVVESNSERTNELTVFKAKANMSVRSFDMVSGMMHEKYKNAFIKQTKMANLTIHTEGSIDSFPKIIPFDDHEKEDEFNKWFDKELLAFFLIGYSLGFVEKSKGKYFLNTEPDNSTSVAFFDISNSGDKFYEIRNFILKNDILNELPFEERLSNMLISSLEKFMDKRENKKEDIRNLWLKKVINELIPLIFKEDYDGDKTDKEYHKILNSIDFIKNNILKL